MRLDPLVGLSSALAARSVGLELLWVLPVLAGTVLLGRAFCGWVCPMGTVQDWVGGPKGRQAGTSNPGVETVVARRANQRQTTSPWERLRYWKYGLAFLALASGLFTSLFFLVLDPLSFLTRSAAVALYPAANLLVTTGQDVLGGLPVGRDLAIAADEALRGSVLPLSPSIFRTSEVFLALFVGLLALNLLASRFWCRYLCPLGGLLALLSRFSLLKRQVTEDCNRCGRCAARCRTGAIEGQHFASDPGECILCLDCASLCPQKAIYYRGAQARLEYSPSRRQVLAAVGVGAVAVLAMRTGSSPATASPFLVRPPGAGEDFLRRCIRCGQCMKVCPTSGLQPTWFDAGLEGLWTPTLVSRMGYCDFRCTSCGQVCPTGAIRRLTLEEKQQTIIGTAYIDQNRCIPWADRQDCIVCEEVCPLPEKAILLDPVELQDNDGHPRIVKRPRVLRNLCIGCGVCEYKCPVAGDSAIRIYTANPLVFVGEGAVTPK